VRIRMPAALLLMVAVLFSAFASVALSCGNNGSRSSASTAAPIPTLEGPDAGTPGPVELYVMNLDGQPQLLTTLPDAPVWVWAPDDDHAALVTNPLKGPQLHAVSVKTGAETTFADASPIPGSLRWSTNGDWLAWADGDLQVARADGSGRQTLQTNYEFTAPQYGALLAWEDDHRLLATVWDSDFHSNNPPIFEFDVTNGSKREVGVPPVASRAELSHDGQRILFLGYGTDDCSSLWIMSVSNGNLRQLPDTCGTLSASWSPDDTEIAYTLAAYGELQPAGVYVADVASGTSRRVGGSTALFDHVLNWSQDGNTLLIDQSKYSFWEDGAVPEALQLDAMSVSSGDETVVSYSPYYTWSLNGAAVASDVGSLQVARAPGWQMQQVMLSDLNRQCYVLDPDDTRAWSDDGQWLAFDCWPAGFTPSP